MGKVTVKIPHVTWRNGRPRFIPGTALRAMGYKGEDLKHPDGRWFSLDEAVEWSAGRSAEIADRRAAKAAGKKPRRPRTQHLVTVGETVEAMLALPKYRPEPDAATRRKFGIRSPHTVKYYRAMARAIEQHTSGIWLEPAAGITAHTAQIVYNGLLAEKGAHMAYGMLTLLRTAWKAARNHLPLNPWSRLDDVVMPEGRIRIGTFAEMAHLIAAADEIGRPEIGDAIVLGLLTGQRQADRLQLVAGGEDEHGRLIFRQQKTGSVVAIRPLAQLTARLDAARVRRAPQKTGMGVNHHNLILDERRWRPFLSGHYRDTFKAVRQHAAKTMPSLAGFRDQDLRDTAVTWLANAGCTDIEICSITGHSPQSVALIRKHYLGGNAEQSENAVSKLDAYLTSRGAKL